MKDSDIGNVFMLVTEIFANNENKKQSIFPALKAMWDYDDELLMSIAIATEDDFEFSSDLLDCKNALDMTLEIAWDELNDKNNSDLKNPFIGDNLLKNTII